MPSVIQTFKCTEVNFPKGYLISISLSVQAFFCLFVFKQQARAHSEWALIYEQCRSGLNSLSQCLNLCVAKGTVLICSIYIVP